MKRHSSPAFRAFRRTDRNGGNMGTVQKGNGVLTTSQTERATYSFSRKSGLALSHPVRDVDPEFKSPDPLAEGLRLLAELPNIQTKPASGHRRLRVFVTGRHTDLGRAVIAHLLARGHFVTAFGTGFEDDLKGVATLVSDFDDSFVMRRVAQQTDAIILCDAPDPGMARRGAITLCRMLVALPPHGRLISANGAICPDCPDAIALDYAILAASKGVPQSVYVLSLEPLTRVRTRQDSSVGQQSGGSRRAGQQPTKRSKAMVVEDCARLLVCLADNGAFKGGVSGWASSAASPPADHVHPARLGFGFTLSPENFGYAAPPQPSQTCSRTRSPEHGPPQTPAVEKRKQETGSVASGWSTRLGRTITGRAHSAVPIGKRERP